MMLQLQFAASQLNVVLFLIILLYNYMQTSVVICVSDPSEVTSLLAIKDVVGDGQNKLSNWVGNDPCSATDQWNGVYCITGSDGVEHVKELRLMQMNFTGVLSPAIGNLTNLTILNFMWNNLTGSVPSEIGKLSNLFILNLNGNKLSGSLPPELGYLSKLDRLQIDSNNISGPLPESFQHLNSVKHIHLNNNSISGSIPKQLGQLPKLRHLLLDNNNMSGELPSELSNISVLIILQLDNNNFNGPIPSSYSKMYHLYKLSLRNCNLSGDIPDFSLIANLSYLNLRNNKLTGQLPSIANKSQYITTIDLSFNELNGVLPENYFQFLNLEKLLLRNNSLDGDVPESTLIHNPFKYANSTLTLDFQYNNFTEFSDSAINAINNVTIRLSGNPVCNLASTPSKYCIGSTDNGDNPGPENTSRIANSSCNSNTCDVDNNQDLVYGLVEQGICHCAYPLIVGYRLKSPSFSIFAPHIQGFYAWISSGLKLNSYQVHVENTVWEPGPRLGMTIKLYPDNTTSRFQQSEIDYLYSVLSNWSMPPNDTFGPYELLYVTIGYPYNETSTNGGKGLGSGAIAGIVFGSIAIIAIIVSVLALLVIRRQLRLTAMCKVPGSTAKRHHKLIKISGVKYFTFEEIAKAANYFDTSREIGQGGYGKVYKGTLNDGTLVAIKRAQEGSLQGSTEFYNEIELLSRVHHRNLVSLIGYCDDNDEQMLVYEYMSNGTLRSHLNSQSKDPLDFLLRLKIALGAAKGILYLHTEANPPIYHRDIKASNILLDDHKTARVADFGLSKLVPTLEDDGKGTMHISTVVKGTPGYLDPEYFLTNQLTDKSDVYSFGVVLLELITGMQPIYGGKNLVREMAQAFEQEQALSLVDEEMGEYPQDTMMSFIDVAVSCCKDDPNSRPSMSAVVRTLQSLWDSSADLTLKPYVLTSPRRLFNNDSTGTPSTSTGFTSSEDPESSLFSGAVLNLNPR